MNRHHDVHVFSNLLHGGWKTTRGKQILANHRPYKIALAIGIRFARKYRVDLVVHGRNAGSGRRTATGTKDLPGIPNIDLTALGGQASRLASAFPTANSDGTLSNV